MVAGAVDRVVEPIAEEGVRLAGEGFKLAGEGMKLAGEGMKLAGEGVKLAGSAARLAEGALRKVLRTRREDRARKSDKPAPPEEPDDHKKSE